MRASDYSFVHFIDNIMHFVDYLRFFLCTSNNIRMFGVSKDNNKVLLFTDSYM